MSGSWNWLQDGHGDDGDTQSQMSMNGRSMPVFAGQKLVVAGGSSGMGRQAAADVVAAGGSAVIIGADGGKVEDTVQELSKDGEAYGITADLADRMRPRPSAGNWPPSTPTRPCWSTRPGCSSRPRSWPPTARPTTPTWS